VERIFAAFTFLYFSDSVIITFSSHYWVHMKKIHFFSGKVVIVTGASSGIGQQLALQLANDGAKLALAARNVQKLEHVARECHQRGAQALVVATDVTQQSQCENLINHTVEAFGCIDTLINNAGITLCARFCSPLPQKIQRHYSRHFQSNRQNWCTNPQFLCCK
jgi:NADP-dependent 3-hydroxy acid dehydrogenase YdfG